MLCPVLSERGFQANCDQPVMDVLEICLHQSVIVALASLFAQAATRNKEPDWLVMMPLAVATCRATKPLRRWASRVVLSISRHAAKHSKDMLLARQRRGQASGPGAGATASSDCSPGHQMAVSALRSEENRHGRAAVLTGGHCSQLHGYPSMPCAAWEGLWLVP